METEAVDQRVRNGFGGKGAGSVQELGVVSVAKASGTLRPGLSPVLRPMHLPSFLWHPRRRKAQP